MKKTLIITMSFVLFILFIANSFKIDVNALSETSNYNTLGLGRTVNIAKDSYLENDKLNNAANIFDLDWFNSRLNSNELIGKIINNNLKDARDDKEKVLKLNEVRI